MSIKDTSVSAWEAEPVTISGGASTTNVVHLGGLRLFSIGMPTAWTTADLTFQASVDGGITFNNVYDKDGGEIVVTADASRYIALDPVIFAAVTHLKIRSGVAAAPINQAADRTIHLVLRGV